MADALEVCEEARKTGGHSSVPAVVQRIADEVAAGNLMMDDFSPECLALGLFERESSWGGRVLGYWGPGVTRDSRPEHSARMVQLRHLDLMLGSDLADQVPRVYTNDEIGSSRG